MNHDTLAAKPRRGGAMALYLTLALAVPLAYVALTHHVWEDFLITFRHSRNLVEGHGLVFNPGRRVQGFTSAINTMAPALFYAISGRSFDLALNLYRALCLAAFVAAGWILLRLLLSTRAHSSTPRAPLLFILLYCTDAKSVAYTMNGQESAFMVLFLSIGLLAAHRGLGRGWLLAAASFAGLLYTRPDAPVYVAAIALAGLAFRNLETRREVIRGILKAGAAAAIVFLPWFIAMWVYYGQPLPNTMLAKSNFDAAQLYNPALLLKLILEHYPRTAAWAFEPIYASFGGWPGPLLDPYSLVCMLIASIYWLIPSPDRLGRLASLLFVLTAMYMSLVSIGAYASPWYLPSVSVFGTVAIARGISRAVALIPALDAPRRNRTVSGILGGYLALMSLLLMVGQTWQTWVQQREIEDNHRRPLALWLHEHAKPDQRIYLEPIGYIGYYSDRLIWDWPGLVTPEIVKLHHELGVDRITIIPHLMPEWMVLRPWEMAGAMQFPEVKENYQVVRTYDARRRLEAYGYIPGRAFLDGDAVYYILKRNDVAPAAGI
jgi:hypothetical protein